MTGITVVEVFRELGVEPEKKATWPVGRAVAKKWRDENGCEPPKENRTKTGGGGMHCFAIYPENFRPVIVRAIQAVSTVAAKSDSQGGLF